MEHSLLSGELPPSGTRLIDRDLNVIEVVSSSAWNDAKFVQYIMLDRPSVVWTCRLEYIQNFFKPL
jgi:hypothetical protein